MEFLLTNESSYRPYIAKANEQVGFTLDYKDVDKVAV